jgi:hypothetical protein
MSVTTSKRMQGIGIAVAALALVGVVVVMTRDNTETTSVFTTPQSRSDSDSRSVTGGGKTQDSGSGTSVFSLPQASPDFVGSWYGVLPATRREPPHWGTDTHAFGTAFFLVNDRVVMKLGLWAGPEAKVTRLNAVGVNPKHVRVENEITAKDPQGASMWIREQRDIKILSRDALECTETVMFYRDPNFTKAVGTVQYRGTLKRASESEMKAHVQEMEQKGMKKQAETEAAVPSR